MGEDAHWYDEVAIPALLRAARTTYGSAIREAMSEAGCDDVPRNGAFVIGGIARNGGSLGDIISALGVSKQARANSSTPSSCAVISTVRWIRRTGADSP